MKSTGDNGSTWIPVMTGPPGPPGASGATGPQGPAGQGIPAGGVEGQVIVRTAGPDYSTAWATPTSVADKDVSFTPVGSPTFADEFTGASLDPNWVHVFPAGGQTRVTWTQSNGVLSMYHNTVADTAEHLHALLRPTGTFAVGDAIVTAIRIGSNYVNYAMAGLILTNGVTHGSGAQVYSLDYIGSTPVGAISTSLRSKTLFTTAGTTVDGLSVYPTTPLFVRLVRTAATTWRHDFSSDGVSWRLGTATLTYTLEPTHMGVIASSWGGTTAHTVTYEFFRRYSGVV